MDDGSLSLNNGGSVGGSCSELNGNSALLELDVGLRSSSLGLQSESIVRFPALFRCYPFPILINSASLKLVDIYRTYPNNFIKFNILRVFEQSLKFLPQITNLEEIRQTDLRRVALQRPHRPKFDPSTPR